MSTTTFTLRDVAVVAHHKLGMTTTAAETALQTCLRQIEELEDRTIDPDQIPEDDVDALITAISSAQRAGDLGELELAALEETATEFERIEEECRAARTRRDEAVRQALTAGARITDVAAAGRITRARVDQIRKAKG